MTHSKAETGHVHVAWDPEASVYTTTNLHLSWMSAETRHQLQACACGLGP